VIAARLSGHLAKWLATLQENSYLNLEKIKKIIGRILFKIKHLRLTSSLQKIKELNIFDNIRTNKSISIKNKKIPLNLSIQKKKIRNDC